MHFVEVLLAKGVITALGKPICNLSRLEVCEREKQSVHVVE